MTEYLALYNINFKIRGLETRVKKREDYIFPAKDNEDAKNKAEEYKSNQLGKVYLPGSIITLDKLFEVKEIKL